MEEARLVAIDDVARWLGVADDESMSDLDWLLGDLHVRFTPDAQHYLAAALIGYFVASGTAGTPHMTYHEVLDSLRVTFHQLWHAPQRHLDLLRRLKDCFGGLVAAWPHPDAKLVVYAVLEDLFQNPEICVLFSDWVEIPEVRFAYDEAVSIASGKRKGNRETKGE